MATFEMVGMMIIATPNLPLDRLFAGVKSSGMLAQHISRHKPQALFIVTLDYQHILSSDGVEPCCILVFRGRVHPLAELNAVFLYLPFSIPRQRILVLFEAIMIMMASFALETAPDDVLGRGDAGTIE